MKTILVPTDFSLAADNAVQYAMEFAWRGNYKIILMHSLELDYKMLLYSLIVTVTDSYRLEAEKLMDDTAGRIAGRKIPYECVIRDEPFADAVVKVAAEKKAAYILMGTKGAHGLKKILAGSNTMVIVERTQCPVLVIPEKAHFKGLQNITYATDYHTSDLEVLKELASLCAVFSAKVRVLHCFTGKLESARTQMLEYIDKVNGTFSKEIAAYNILKGKTTPGKLREFLEETNTDLLSLSIRKRSFMERFLEAGTTGEFAFRSTLPLLIFHRFESPVII